MAADKPLVLGGCNLPTHTGFYLLYELLLSEIGLLWVLQKMTSSCAAVVYFCFVLGWLCNWMWHADHGITDVYQIGIFKTYIWFYPHTNSSSTDYHFR